MSLRKFLGIGALVLSLASFGCRKVDDEIKYQEVGFPELFSKTEEFEGQLVNLVVIPSSVTYGPLCYAQTAMRAPNRMAIVGWNLDNQKILCYSEADESRNREYTCADSLVNSEINDNDEEAISIRGVVKRSVLEMDSIKVNGYDEWIQLRNPKH